MSIVLEISGGPETGKKARFEAPVVTIGRGPKNDLVLQDGLVSQYHGELVVQPNRALYRDLRSRHGTLVRLHHVTVNLHDRERTQEISLIDGAQLMMGESLIRVALDGQPSSDSRRPFRHPSAGATSSLDEQFVTKSQDSIEAVARKLSSQDPRLVSIFKLSRRLNAAPNLSEVLDLIVEATFEAFPAANFFAITLLPDAQSSQGSIGSLEPLVSRERSPDSPMVGNTPLLSQSLLEQVAATRESVLFVRDEAGSDLSQSIINARIMACLAAPLVGERELLGVMQADTRGLGGLFGPDDLDLFTVMASYAAFAIERIRLNQSIVKMFEGFVGASVTAVDARDPATAGHSERVAQTTVELARAVNAVNTSPFDQVHFSEDELMELRYAALLHDFGKVGVSENVLVKAERLHPRARVIIDERFESIKHKLAFDLQRRLIEATLREARPVDDEVLRAVDSELVNLCSRMDGLRDEVLASLTDERLGAHRVERLKEIASLTYVDLDGISKPYITAEELEHLTIPAGTLTVGERDHMRAHARLSRDYLEQIPWSDHLSRIPHIAALHHERPDGSGYPDGLKGEQIPIQVRILTVCDVFDAMVGADRPYRKALSLDQALSVLYAEADKGALDRGLVALFDEKVLPRIAAQRQEGGPD